MFSFLLTCCFTFIFLPLACEMRLFPLRFWKHFSLFSITKSIRNAILGFKNKSCSLKVERAIETPSSLLDLPELVMECILEKLPPEGLCRMACVCNSLKDTCKSDHLWEKHMSSKWARIVGPAAHREWKWLVASGTGSVLFFRSGNLIGYLTHLWPLVFTKYSFSKKKSFAPVDSIMCWYFALQSGKFRFPAQVYNRENGHVGFMLSCYDAELSYDLQTDTFLARYPPNGSRPSVTENGITWDRLRSSPVDTSPHDLHVSDCLNELEPGDHVEIQWRRNHEFPYGWWYGVIGHMETCNGNAGSCQCRDNDTLVLEFNHYASGSRWRTTTVNRNNHMEEGNETDGFYGGIRKISSNVEISTWQKLWPSEVLD